MTGWRVYPPILAAGMVVFAGCGSNPAGPTLAPPAKQRSFRLGWIEHYRSAHFTFRVERLAVTAGGWQAQVVVENNSETAFRLAERSAGLVLLETRRRSEIRRLTGGFQHPPPALKPDRISPEPPPALRPGASWSATISGSEILRRGSVVRVLFGPFSSIERYRAETEDVQWVTDHSIRI